MLSCISDKRVLVEPYTHQVEAGEVVVAFSARRIFIVLQPDVFEILEQLAKGATTKEVEELYVHTYGEAPDLDSFVEELSQRGLAKYIDASIEKKEESVNQVNLLDSQSSA